MSSEVFVCEVCNLDYSTWGQFQEHFWSMIHHKQLENTFGSGQTHICSLCKVNSDSLSSYAKHLIGQTHRVASDERKKRKQLQVSTTSSSKSQSSNGGPLHTNQHHGYQQHQNPPASSNGPPVPGRNMQHPSFSGFNGHLPDPAGSRQNQCSWTRQPSYFRMWGDNYVDQSNIHRSFQQSSAQQWNYGNGRNYIYSGNRTWMPMNDRPYTQNGHYYGGHNNPYTSNMANTYNGGSGGMPAQTTQSNYQANAKSFSMQKSAVSKGGCNAVANKSVAGLKNESASNKMPNPSSGVKDKTQSVAKSAQDTSSCGDQTATKTPSSNRSGPISKLMASSSKQTQQAVGSKGPQPVSQAPLNDKSDSQYKAETTSSKPNQEAGTVKDQIILTASSTYESKFPTKRRELTRWDNPGSTTRCLSDENEPVQDGACDQAKSSTNQGGDKNPRKTPVAEITSKSTEAGKEPDPLVARKSSAGLSLQSRVKPLPSGLVNQLPKATNTAAVHTATEKSGTTTATGDTRIVAVSGALNRPSHIHKLSALDYNTMQQEGVTLASSTSSKPESFKSSEPTPAMLQKSVSVPTVFMTPKAPPKVTRLTLPRANSDPGDKKAFNTSGPLSDGTNIATIKPVSGPADGLDEEASVTRIQLPPSLQRELTKLLVKSQVPRPRPNLATSRSRLHAGEHLQAQVVNSPDRMVQQLLMKLLDLPKSRDRQVQQIEELQQLLQASRKGSERARFAFQQFPEVSQEDLESLLQSGHLKPLLSEDASSIFTMFAKEHSQVLAGHEHVPSSKAKKTKNPIKITGLHQENPASLPPVETELVDSKEAVRALINATTLNQVHPVSSSAPGQEDLDSKESLKSLVATTDHPATLPTPQTLPKQKETASPEVANVPYSVEQRVEAIPQEPNAEELSVPFIKTEPHTEIGDEDHLEKMSSSATPGTGLCNSLQFQAVERSSICEPHEPGALVCSHESASGLPTQEKWKQGVPEDPTAGDPPGSLQEVLLELSLQEEVLHKKLGTEERSMKTTKELIQKKQLRFSKLKEQKQKISLEVLAIRTKRLQLLTDASHTSCSACTVPSPAIDPPPHTSNVSSEVSRPSAVTSWNANLSLGTATLRSCRGKATSNSLAINQVGVPPKFVGPPTRTAGGSLPRGLPGTRKPMKHSANDRMAVKSDSMKAGVAKTGIGKDQKRVAQTSRTSHWLKPGAPARSVPAQPAEQIPSTQKHSAQDTPTERADPPANLQEVLLELSLQEEMLHKKLEAVERSIKATKKLIQKKQLHFRQIKDRKDKVSKEISGIRTKRLQLLTDATSKTSPAIHAARQTTHVPGEVSRPCTPSISNTNPIQDFATLRSCLGEAVPGTLFSNYATAGQADVPPDFVCCPSGTAQSTICLDSSFTINGDPRTLKDAGKPTESPASDQLVVEGDSAQGVVVKIETEEDRERDVKGVKRKEEQDAAVLRAKRAKMAETAPENLAEIKPVGMAPVTWTLQASNESALGTSSEALLQHPSGDADINSELTVPPPSIVQGSSPCKQWMKEISTCRKWVKEVKLYKMDTQQGREVAPAKTEKLAGDEQVQQPSVDANVDVKLKNDSVSKTESCAPGDPFAVFEISSDTEVSDAVNETVTETWQFHTLTTSATAHKRTSPPCGVFPNHNGAVLGMSIDSRSLYTVSADRTARVYDIDRLSCEKVLSDHRKEVTCLTFWNHRNLASNKYLCTGSSDCNVQIYNKRTLDHETTFVCDNRVTCLVVRGDNVYAAMTHGGVNVFSMKTWEKVKNLPCKPNCKIEVMIVLNWPLCTEWNKSLWLIIGYEDWTIGVHTLVDGRLLKSLHGHDGSILCMKTHANFLYSGSADKTVMVHDLECGKQVTTIRGHANSVTGLELYGQNLIITACIDGKVRQFSRKGGNLQRVIASYPQMILCMTRHLDTLYIGCTDGTVQSVSVNPPPQTEKLRKLPTNAKKKKSSQKDVHGKDSKVKGRRVSLAVEEKTGRREAKRSKKQKKAEKRKDVHGKDHKDIEHQASLAVEEKKRRKKAKRLRKQKKAEKRLQLHTGCADDTVRPKSVKPKSVKPKSRPKKLKKLSDVSEEESIKVKRHCQWSNCTYFTIARMVMSKHLRRSHLRKSKQCLWDGCELQFTRKTKNLKGLHADDHLIEFYEGSAAANAVKQRRESKRLQKLNVAVK